MSQNKKAALELSIGTIVVIVIAITMLILGLVLVQQIFSGAGHNVNEIDQKVRDEIGKLFTEDKKVVIYLPNKLAEIKQGESWGIAFAIKNLETGVSEVSTYSYDVSVSEPNLKRKCGITDSQALNWITTGEADSGIKISPGGTTYGLIRFNIPEGAPLCTVRFHLNIKRDGTDEPTDFFDVEVKP